MSDIFKDDYLYRLIGARMITVYNDAKRVTLSGWSWPSRQIASKIANNFEINGNASHESLDYNFDYLTPQNHAEFLNCIVKTDVTNLKSSLRQSLAASLRVDGSVDKAGLHNIYVMAHIISDKCTTSTFFIWFGVPEVGRAEGYFECVKTIVSKIMPFDEFFELITSVATDGEPLNIGHLNGLHAKLKMERQRSNSRKPLHLLWCVAHRINLAWKSVSSNRIINKNVQFCRQLPAHFNTSAVRLNELKKTARDNQLSPPLRYPPFLAIRWTEFVSNLFNVVLRNWRAACHYFVKSNKKSFLDVWLYHDTIHFIFFLADILSLVKIFQKSCQSDSICITDVLPLRAKFIESLESCRSKPLSGGWEEMFFAKKSHVGNQTKFYGFTLSHNRRRSSFSFTDRIRQMVIRSLMNHINIRIGMDSFLHEQISPLVNLDVTMDVEAVKRCFASILPDVDEETFLKEYYDAADLLKDASCDTTLKILQHLNRTKPNRFRTLKIALARVAAIKPHSADVERLIIDAYVFIFSN